MKRRRSLFFLLLVMAIALFPRQTIEGFQPCNCEDTRTIFLTDPLMQGEDIKILQEGLKRLGLYQGGVDGIYGFQSRKAVLNYQRLKNIEQNGVVDKKVWQLLDEILDHYRPEPITRTTRPPTGAVSIRVSLYSRLLTVMVNGQPFRNYPVTVGEDNASPVGEWYIKNKYVRLNKGPLGSRWLGLNVPWGVYGIHGTSKPWEIGRATSNGCIRLHNQHIEEIFEWVSVGTRVVINGPWPDIKLITPIKPGESGRNIQALQRRLRKTGYYDGYLNGYYGESTERAVREIEAKFNLKLDGVTDENILALLD